MIGYVALGSNLGDRVTNLRAGLDEMRHAGIELGEQSSVWATEPVDCPSPFWFLNMVTRIRARMHPLELLDRLLHIEKRHGRNRDRVHGPRRLDLDLLTLADLEWSDSRLRLPHPRMWERRFVLEPLAEIAPELVDAATGRTVLDHRNRTRDRSSLYSIGPLSSC